MSDSYETKTVRFEYEPGKSATVTITRVDPTDTLLSEEFDGPLAVFLTYGELGPKATTTVSGVMDILWVDNGRDVEAFHPDAFEANAEPLLERVHGNPGLWDDLEDGDVLTADDVEAFVEKYPYIDGVAPDEDGEEDA